MRFPANFPENDKMDAVQGVFQPEEDLDHMAGILQAVNAGVQERAVGFEFARGAGEKCFSIEMGGN